MARSASTGEVKDLRRETRDLKEAVAVKCNTKCHLTPVNDLYCPERHNSV